MHIHGDASRLMQQALDDNFSVLTINVDYPDFPSLQDQQSAAISLRQRYPERAAFVATFSVDNFQSPEWAGLTIAQLQVAVAAGAVGVKIWKNIGMSLRDPDGHYVMPDDSRFEPVLEYLEAHDLVLLGHQAEPLNCWLPLNKMTVRSDREYFTEHPQYYMYRHPQMPAHATILAARDRMLEAHPHLVFDGVHLASLEWDVDQLAPFLERFPQARVDLAARLVHLEYQAHLNREKVRRFLIRYQDRILYGSDDAYGPSDTAQAAREVHTGWVEDWRFLATGQALHSSEFKGAFRGLDLPRDVIDKLYRTNAQRLFVRAWRPAAGDASSESSGVDVRPSPQKAPVSRVPRTPPQPGGS